MDKRSLIFVFCVTTCFFAIHTWFAPAGAPAPFPTKANQTEEHRVVQNFSTSKIDVEDSFFTERETTPLTKPFQEEFYVIENEYQQLVFSTRGGSLAEINLPLKDEEHPTSIVREIGIDRDILIASPENARFPLYSYIKLVDGKRVSSSQGTLGGYYPLLRRHIIRSNGAEKTLPLSQYYAFHILDETLSELPGLYQVTRFESNLIQFQASFKGRKITKTFFIPQQKNGPYCFELEIQIDGDASGLWLSSGVPDVEIVGGTYAPLLRYQVLHTGSFDVETISLPKKGTVASLSKPNWISNSNGFLGIIMDPLKVLSDGYKAIQIPGTTLPTRLSLVDASQNLYPPDKYPGYATFLPLKSMSNFRIFAGPYDDGLLKKLDVLYEDPSGRYNPEYVSAQSIQGWFSFISQPFAKFLFFLMQGFYWLTRSWAASIILLTLALRMMMYPLNAWSIRSSLKMQEISPKVKLIQEKYKKDPRKAQLEVMNLYKQSKVNPLTGCLPMLLQMPFLIGMFYLLKSSFPLRGAPFIPGWINNLAAPDVLFSWKEPIWFIGNEFHLLPILMGITMFIQQKMTTKLPKNANQMTDSERQQKAMGNIMGVLFTVMFYNFPSGLNIYFMFSTLFGILQQWWMGKKMGTTPSILIKK